MNTPQRDPIYVAKQTRLLREVLGFTQENLANAANISTRTIEKVESGRHVPEEQTLRSIARAAGVEVSWFNKRSPAEEAQAKATIERTRKHVDIVPISPVASVADFLAAMTNVKAVRFDASAVRDDAALKFAAEVQDYIDDIILAWGDLTSSDQFGCGEEFLGRCRELEMMGYLCLGGRHKERYLGMTLDVGVFCVLPKSLAKETRYALVQLEGGWEKAVV